MLWKANICNDGILAAALPPLEERQEDKKAVCHCQTAIIILANDSEPDLSS